MSGQEFQTVVQAGEKGSIIELTGTVNRGAKEALESAYEEASGRPGEIDWPT